MQDSSHPSAGCGTRPACSQPAAALALVALAALTGCATALAPAAPELDARLGTATRQALAQQVLRPQAGTGAPDATAPFDGAAAVHTLARHREGFKAPPSSFSVLGIGSGTGQP
jgi:hypothetical protein